MYERYLRPLHPPAWDEFGSTTLYTKILYCNYDERFTILEMFGEWNDCLYNDIMYLERNVIEPMIEAGIDKFILIGENILNFHASEDDYYQEWFDEIEDCWITGLNFREHVLKEFMDANIDYYIAFGGVFDTINWRAHTPSQLCEKIENQMQKRLTV